MDATTSILFSNLHTSLPSPSLFLFPQYKFPLLSKSSPSLIHLRISNSTNFTPLKFPFYPSNTPLIRPTFELQSSAEGVALLEIPNENVQKLKLYVRNLPYSFTSDTLKEVFSECGTVKDIELIKDNVGKNKGYGFVTMESEDEAQAVIDKFNSKELSGRTIKVEFAKSLTKPLPEPPVPVKETRQTRHVLYVANLQWKVRSIHLKEFFSSDFTPVSARVVFERSPSGRSAGYGFVSFNTREEAEAALSSLDGKELLGRPVRLKFSERSTDGESSNKVEGTDNLDESTGIIDEKEVSDDQPDES